MIIVDIYTFISNLYIIYIIYYLCILFTKTIMIFPLRARTYKAPCMFLPVKLLLVNLLLVIILIVIIKVII